MKRKSAGYRKEMFSKLPKHVLKQEVAQWEFRWKNGIKGHKLYFGLRFGSKADYLAAKKVLRSK